MHRLFISLVSLNLIASAWAADSTPFVLESVEKKFNSDISKAQADVTRAEADLVKARKVASTARLKAYKDRLTEITKTGDFDKAQTVKARIEELEQEAEDGTPKTEKSAKRARPKETVKFGGHSYAIIKDAATWHVAKRRCEEMGGHLAIVERDGEKAFLLDLVKSLSLKAAWIGASDEEFEGNWKWVDGTEAKVSGRFDNENGGEHFMELHTEFGFNDQTYIREAYICEWDR